MAEHQQLTRSLAEVARRLRLRRALRELTSGAIWLLAAFVAYRLLRALITSTAAVSALQPLFILVGIAGVAIFIWRLMPRVTLAQAAGVADAGANLYDELKTAYWFAAQNSHSPLVSLQIRRASATAQSLDPHKLVCVAFPRRIMLAFVLALAGGALVWVAPGSWASKSLRWASANSAVAGEFKRPRTGKPNKGATDIASTAETRAQPLERDIGSGSEEQQSAGALEATETGQRDSENPIGTQLEETARSIRSKVEGRAADAPPNAGDVQPIALPTGRAFKRAAASAQPPTAGSIGNIADDLISTLEGALDELSNSTKRASDGGSENAVTGGAEVREKGDEAARGTKAAQANITEGASKSGEGAAAAPLSGQRQQEATQGQGQGPPSAGDAATQPGGMIDFAMLTTSSGGGSPKAPPVVEIKGMNSESTQGERTKRLEMPVHRVKIDSTPDTKATGTGEPFFAATRWRQSDLWYQTMAPKAHYVREDTMDGERVPLAYRSTVKEYFLSLQQKGK